MEHAVNRTPLNYESCTENVGWVIDSAQRGGRAWPPGNAGRHGRNAFREPEEFIVGSHGRIGGNDPDNTNDYDGDFDGDDDINMGGGRSHA